MTNTYDMLLNPPPNKAAPLSEEKKNPGLLANQQTSIEEKQQASKEEVKLSGKAANQQASKEEVKHVDKEEKQQTGKPVNNQTTKSAKQQPSKSLKKFASFLETETFYAWKALTIQLRKKDYEVLQEAVEAFIQQKKST